MYVCISVFNFTRLWGSENFGQFWRQHFQGLLRIKNRVFACFFRIQQVRPKISALRDFWGSQRGWTSCSEEIASVSNLTWKNTGMHTKKRWGTALCAPTQDCARVQRRLHLKHLQHMTNCKLTMLSLYSSWDQIFDPWQYQPQLWLWSVQNQGWLCLCK